MKAPSLVSCQVVLREPSGFTERQAETRIPQKQVYPQTLSITDDSLFHLVITVGNTLKTRGNRMVLSISEV